MEPQRQANREPRQRPRAQADAVGRPGRGGRGKVRDIKKFQRAIKVRGPRDSPSPARRVGEADRERSDSQRGAAESPDKAASGADAVGRQATGVGREQAPRVKPTATLQEGLQIKGMLHVASGCRRHG